MTYNSIYSLNMYLLKIILFGHQHQLAKRLLKLGSQIIIEPITIISFSVLIQEVAQLLHGPHLLTLQIIFCDVDSAGVEVEFGVFEDLLGERGVREVHGFLSRVFIELEEGDAQETVVVVKS